MEAASFRPPGTAASPCIASCSGRGVARPVALILPANGRCQAVGRRKRSPPSRPQQAAERLRCYATIPAPAAVHEPVLGVDLGWDTTFAQNFVKGKLIGQGSFGNVFLGIDLHSGQEVAIKVMPKQRGKLTKERTLQKLVKEVNIMARLQECTNVVRLIGCYESDTEVMLVTELCSGGDLQKLSDDRGPMCERAVAHIAYEVLKVVKCCHDNGVLHGDVKPANFVLKHRTKNPLVSPELDLMFTPWLRAIDFGCSQFLTPARFNKRTGTPVYMAPEIFDRDYSWEADMWSVGMMSYQLFARRFPYWDTYEACRTAKLEEVAVLVQEARLPFDYGPWLHMSKQGLAFIQACLDRDMVSRMTVDEALDHAWFDEWLPDGTTDGLLPGSAASSDDECSLMGGHNGGAAGAAVGAAVAAAAAVTNNIVPAASGAGVGRGGGAVMAAAAQQHARK